VRNTLTPFDEPLKSRATVAGEPNVRPEGSNLKIAERAA
jgi:hypothetical protein